MNFSKEQLDYITCNRHLDKREHVKLIATAGSGKTLCIIKRIDYVIQNEHYAAEDICVLTFSKHAREDFKEKIDKHLHSDYSSVVNVMTIDSLAYKVLGELSKSLDISILSFVLMSELEKCENSDEIYEKFPKLSEIKMLFVDEAQDLNDVQAKIILIFKDVCGMSVNLVGDPNQNIFQFRKTSDKYLLNFPGKIYYLTQNFRSRKHIVDFSSHLRPYRDKEIVSTESTSQLKTTFYAYNSASSLENQLMYLINIFKTKKIPFHKVAILSPTRGYLKERNGIINYKGLCFVSNLLYQNNISFSQFYSLNDGDKTTYRPTRNHINLMTYTSSKGLEWDYVILIDANYMLLSSKNYSTERHLEEQYLLYVAASRPKKNLIIFCKDHIANPWFSKIPKDLYFVSKYSQHNFEISEHYDNKVIRDVREVKEPITEPTIEITEEELLYNIYLQSEKNVQTNSLLINDNLDVVINKRYTDILNNFLKSLLNFAEKDTVWLDDVHSMLSTENIIQCDNEYIITWYYRNKDRIQDWESEKKNHNIKIVSFIDEHFVSDGVSFNQYTLIDKYSKFIYNKKDTIKNHIKTINNYKDGEDKLIEKLFMVSLITYSIKTSHYYYIDMYNQIKKTLLTKDNIISFKNIIRHHQGNFNCLNGGGSGNGSCKSNTIIRYAEKTSLKDIISVVKQKGDSNMCRFINIWSTGSNVVDICISDELKSYIRKSMNIIIT